MAFWGDYHTHTVYSHARGSIEHNVRMARDKGLKQIAITDHGFRHVAFNVRRSDFKFMQRDIAFIRDKYEVDIFLGLETNLQGRKGQIDIVDSDMQNLDVLLCGYHEYVYPASVKDFFSFFIPNHIPFHRKSDLMKGRNTEAYINAINRYPIDVIVHPKYGIEIDVVELAKECKKLGVFLELNGKRISMSDDEIAGMAETGVGIICNSDAHSPEHVGDFAIPVGAVERNKIPYEQIVNWDKLPDFRSRRLKAEGKL